MSRSEGREDHAIMSPARAHSGIVSPASSGRWACCARPHKHQMRFAWSDPVHTEPIMIAVLQGAIVALDSDLVWQPKH